MRMPRRLNQMHLASQASCRNCSSSGMGVDLQGADAADVIEDRHLKVMEE